MEATKASEFEAVQQELLTSKQRYAALQSSNKGIVTQLRALQETARALTRDYKAHKTSSRTGMVEMGQAIQTQYKPMLVGKLQVSTVLLYCVYIYTSILYCSITRYAAAIDISSVTFYLLYYFTI